jgi:hypothetical protein
MNLKVCEPCWALVPGGWRRGWVVEKSRIVTVRIGKNISYRSIDTILPRNPAMRGKDKP